MNRFWYSALFVLATIKTAYGAGKVTVNCNYDVAEKIVQFTAEGTLGNGQPPQYLRIVGCNAQIELSGGSGMISIGASGICTNVNWGDYFSIALQQSMDFFQSGDEQWGILCAYDTSTLTPFNSVSVSSLATAGTTVSYITPTASVFITTDDTCETTAGNYVTVGTQLYLCIFLGDEYISPDGFDGRVVKIKVTSLKYGNAPDGIALTTSGCKVAKYLFWSEVAAMSQGKFYVPFTAFMYSILLNDHDVLKFQAFIDVCKYDVTSEYCGGYTCDTNNIYRRKREALNKTETIGQVEVSTSITVSAGPLRVPDENNHQDSSPTSDDNICLQKGGFYGLILFFILALLSTVLASCFLFMKARKSRKYVDERHLYESGSHNQSFRG